MRYKGNICKKSALIVALLMLTISPAIAVESVIPSVIKGGADDLSAVELTNTQGADKSVAAVVDAKAPLKAERVAEVVDAKASAKVESVGSAAEVVDAEAPVKAEVAKAASEVEVPVKTVSSKTPVKVEKLLSSTKMDIDFLPPAASGGLSARPLAAYLADWQHDGEVVRLSDANDKKIINVFISSRQNVESIVVHIDFTNSISLSSGRSQLRFRFNGHIVGQAKLDPIFPSGGLDLKIPGSYVKNGDNELIIESSLHTGKANSALYSSELWAEIDVKTSSVTIQTNTRVIEATLAALPELVRGGVNRGYYPLILQMAEESPADGLLNAAAVAVQGLAQYTGNVPVKVATTLSLSDVEADKPAVDRLLIGTFEQLSDVIDMDKLSDAMVDTDAAQLIATYPHPVYKHCFMLVIAGQTVADVQQAAMRFASMDTSVEMVSALASKGLSSEQIVDGDQRDGVQQNMRYTFEQLGLSSTELHGVKDAAEVTVKMPPDLFAISDEDVDLIVHFSYSAGLGQGSSISVLLNGEFQQSIALDSATGMLIKDYKIKIPLRAFERGNNTIRLQGNLVPGPSAKEHEYMAKAINVTIFEDSVVRIPSLSHYVRMPDLDLLKRTGFPYVREAATQSVLYLTAVDEVHISAAMMMIAKISQVHESVVKGLLLTRSLSTPETRNIIVLGTTSEVSDQYWQASSIRKDGESFWFSPTDAFATEGVPYNPLTTMIGFEHMVEAFTRSASKAGTMQQLDMQHHGLVSQFESPFHEESTVTLIAAESLAAGVAQLVLPQVWDGLNKDTVIWELESEKLSAVHAYKLSDEYFTGELSLPGKIAYMSITSPLFLFGLVFALIVLLTWLTRAMVHHHRHKAHPGMRD